MKHVRLIIWCSLAALMAAGCDMGLTAVKEVHPALGQNKVETLETAYQFAKGRKIEIVMAKVWSLPAGETAPDFEYYYIQLPDTDGKYVISEKGTTVYRLVRKDGQEALYKSTSGWVNYRFGFLTKDHVHGDFDVNFVPVWPQNLPPAPQEFKGTIRAQEDVRVCQGLVNKYHRQVLKMEALAKAANEPPAPEPVKPVKTKKSKTKTPAAPAPAAPAATSAQPPAAPAATAVKPVTP
jgi:hypothetical protein